MSAPRRISLLRRVAAVGFVAVVLVVALAFTPQHAQAQTFDITGISSIQAQANGWFATAQGWAQRTYGLLLVIELTILGIQGVLFRENLAEFMATFGFKIFVAGFFMWLIANADPFFHGIVNGFSSAGQQLGTDSSGMTAVMAEGLASAGLLFGAASVGHGIDTSMSFFPNLYFGTGATGYGDAASSGHALFDMVVSGIGMMTVFSMAGILIQYAMITIESYIVMSAGVLFLGFSGTRFTMPFSQGYLSYSVNVGVKLFTFYLMLGAVQGLMPNALIFSGATLAAAAIPMGYGSLIALLPAAIAGFSLLLVATLLYAVPNFAGSFLSGTSSLSAGAMMGQFGNAMSGMAQMRAGFAQLHRANDASNALTDLRSHRQEHTETNVLPTSTASTGGPSGPMGMMPEAATATALGVGANVPPDAQRTGMDDDIGQKRSAEFVAAPPVRLVSTPGQQRPAAALPNAAPAGAAPTGIGLNGGALSGTVLSGSAAAGTTVPSAATQPTAFSTPASYVAVNTGAGDHPAGPPILNSDGTPMPGPATSSTASSGRMFQDGDDLPKLQPEQRMQMMAATRWEHVPENVKGQIRDNPMIAAEAEIVYGDELKRDQIGPATGAWYVAGGMRTMIPPPDAPVTGVQIRLSNPDKI